MWTFKRPPEAPAVNPLTFQLDLAVADANRLRATLAESRAKLDALSFEGELHYGREPGESREAFLSRRELELDAVRLHPGSKAMMNVLLEVENEVADAWLGEKDPLVAERIRVRASVAAELRSRLITALNTKRVREERARKHVDSQAAEHARFLRESGIEKTS